MKLAINYSQPAAKLVQSGAIKFDYFKTPDWDWMIGEAQRLKPVAVHFTLEIGNHSLENVDWDKIRYLAASTGTPYVNFHLDPRGSSYPDIQIDSLAQSDVQRVVEVIRSDIAIAVEKLGAERIIVENSPYWAEQGSTMRLCIEPEMICRLLEETGCSFLLDISHAIITSKTIGMEPGKYLAQLPINRLKELHFAGIQPSPTTGKWMDHLAIQEEDWYWLSWVLEQIESGKWGHPWMLAFEYGGVGEQFEWRSDPLVIADQVPQLYERISKVAIYSKLA